MAKNKKTEKVSPVIGKDLPSKTFQEDRVSKTGQLFDPTTGYGRSVRRPGSMSFKDFLKEQGIDRQGLSKGEKATLERDWEASGGGYKMDWLLTDAGQNFATNEPEAYMNALFARAGGMSGPSPLVGGATQFGQFLANDYKDMLDAGYDAALMASGGRLGRADYLNSMGFGARANVNAFNLPMGAATSAPVDTGNPFTSSSLPTTSKAGGLNAAAAPGIGKNGIPEVPKFKDFLSQQGYDPKTFKKDVFKEDRNELKTVFRNPNAALSTTGGGVDHARQAYLSLTPQQRGVNSATGFKPGRWAVF
jgi:hypothetical protein